MVDLKDLPVIQSLKASKNRYQTKKEKEEIDGADVDATHSSNDVTETNPLWHTAGLPFSLDLMSRRAGTRPTDVIHWRGMDQLYPV